jgi:tripartite-type tricarboxylate transporter receptor subunit TctC
MVVAIAGCCRAAHAAPADFNETCDKIYDAVVLTDFEPVALISTSPWVFVAKKTMPANDLKGLIAWLKANPDKATQGHAGTGGATHIAGLFLQRETGTRFQFVPYRGGAAQYIQDLVAGQIDLAFSDPIAALPQVNAGTIKAYGVTTKARLRSAPDRRWTRPAQGHAEKYHRQSQCRSHGRLGRPDGAGTAG